MKNVLKSALAGFLLVLCGIPVVAAPPLITSVWQIAPQVRNDIVRTSTQVVVLNSSMTALQDGLTAEAATRASADSAMSTVIATHTTQIADLTVATTTLAQHSLNKSGDTMTGPLTYTYGTPGTGKVLTSDASGNASWQTASGGGLSEHLLTTYTISSSTGYISIPFTFDFSTYKSYRAVADILISTQNVLGPQFLNVGAFVQSDGSTVELPIEINNVDENSSFEVLVTWNWYYTSGLLGNCLVLRNDLNSSTVLVRNLYSGVVTGAGASDLVAFGYPATLPTSIVLRAGMIGGLDALSGGTIKVYGYK